MKRFSLPVVFGVERELEKVHFPLVAEGNLKRFTLPCARELKRELEKVHSLASGDGT